MEAKKPALMSNAIYSTSGEQMVTCPYNNAHVVTAKRYMRHLLKCQDNHGSTNLVLCQFSNTHRVPERELEYHYLVCEYRKNFEHFFVKRENSNPNVLPVEEIAKKQVISDECWDADDGQPPVNVLKSIKQSVLQRDVRLQFIGGTKSQRENFLQQERERLKKIQENGGEDHTLEQQSLSTVPRGRGTRLPRMDPLCEDDNESVSSFYSAMSSQSSVGSSHVPKGRGRGRGRPVEGRSGVSSFSDSTTEYNKLLEQMQAQTIGHRFSDSDDDDDDMTEKSSVLTIKSGGRRSTTNVVRQTRQPRDE